MKKTTGTDLPVFLTDGGDGGKISIVTGWSLYFNTADDRVVTKRRAIDADKNIYGTG